MPDPTAPASPAPVVPAAFPAPTAVEILASGDPLPGEGDTGPDRVLDLTELEGRSGAPLEVRPAPLEVRSGDGVLDLTFHERGPRPPAGAAAPVAPPAATSDDTGTAPPAPSEAETLIMPPLPPEEFLPPAVETVVETLLPPAVETVVEAVLPPPVEAAAAPVPPLVEAVVEAVPPPVPPPVLTPRSPAPSAAPVEGPSRSALLGDVQATLAGLDTPASQDDPHRHPSPLGYAAEGLRHDAETLLHLLDAQALARWLDVAAVDLRAGGRLTDTARRHSAGYESAAAIALVARPTDPALLHGRSAAFFLARALQVGHRDAVRDAVRGLVPGGVLPGTAATAFGHADLAVIPHTSTLGGHLPRAVGLAWAIGRQRKIPERLRAPLAWPDDAVSVVAFDAAVTNHSTATGAVNSACLAAWREIPLPLLMICEDREGITSPPAAQDWVRAVFEGRAGLEYMQVDGTDPLAAIGAARWAVEVVRDSRSPVLLHVLCPEFPARRRAPGVRVDPLAVTMRTLVDGGVLTPEQVRQRWTAAGDRVAEAVAQVLAEPPGVSRRASGRGAVPALASLAARTAAEADRSRVFGGALPETEGPLTLADSINRALLDMGAADPRVLLFGSDLNPAVTHGTTSRFRRLGASRVVDAITDERSVLGLALGAGVSGLLPIVGIQDVSGLRDAQDQLRGQAVALARLADGTYRNPLVVRVPAFGAPAGWGPGAHADHALGMLRDIPGLVIACPVHPCEAPSMLRTCLAVAEAEGTVCVVLEPVSLYGERDMIGPGDGAWTAPYLPPHMWPISYVPLGRAAVWGAGGDLTLVTFGNGVRVCLQAAGRLAAEGVEARVVDLRWLAPLPLRDVLREARATGRLLVVDETWGAGGLAESLLTGLLEEGFTGRMARLRAAHHGAGPSVIDLEEVVALALSLVGAASGDAGV